MKKILLILVLIVILSCGFYFFLTKKTSTPTQSVNVPTPTPKENSATYQITQALSAKNSWNASGIEVNITSLEGDFAKGDIKMKGEMSGGLWFAAKVNGIWKIVYDGNGIITCDRLRDYKNFPKDLIPSCYDKQTETLIAR
jgi:hypothetical protein